jgi:hypothetical protein
MGDIYTRRREAHDFTIDCQGTMSEEDYQLERSRLTPQQIQHIHAEWIDNPACIESYNRLDYANIPNAFHLGDLAKYSLFISSCWLVSYIFLRPRTLQERVAASKIDIERIMVARMVPEGKRKIVTGNRFVVTSLRALEWEYFIWDLREGGFTPVSLFSLIY